MSEIEIQFYDTRSRSLRRFEPLEAGKVGIYTCGPTVYGGGIDAVAVNGVLAYADGVRHGEHAGHVLRRT